MLGRFPEGNLQMCARRICHSEATRDEATTCFREGVRGPPWRWYSRVPDDAREVGRGSGGFPGGKPVNVCAPGLLFQGRVGDGASGASATAMRPEWEVSLLLPRRAGVPDGLGDGSDPPSALRRHRARQSDGTRPRTEPAARVTTPSPRSAFSTNGRSGAHTFAGFPPGNLLDLPARVVAGRPGRGAWA